MGRHVDGPLQLAQAEHLQAIAQFSNFANLRQPVRTERIAFESVQPSQIDNGILLLENVGEPALGQPAMQGHLAAFKSAHDAVAGNRARALVPAAGGLADPRSHAASHALLRMFLSSGRFQIAEIHNCPYSTTANRCGIFLTIPRNPGVSGRSTTWLILRSPRLRTITLCFSGVQIGLRTSLILILESMITTPSPRPARASPASRSCPATARARPRSLSLRCADCACRSIWLTRWECLPLVSRRAPARRRSRRFLPWRA